VPAEEVPGGGEVAAILRYAVWRNTGILRERVVSCTDITEAGTWLMKEETMTDVQTKLWLTASGAEIIVRGSDGVTSVINELDVI